MLRPSWSVQVLCGYWGSLCPVGFCSGFFEGPGLGCPKGEDAAAAQSGEYGTDTPCLSPCQTADELLGDNAMVTKILSIYNATLGASVVALWTKPLPARAASHRNAGLSPGHSISELVPG